VSDDVQDGIHRLIAKLPVFGQPVEGRAGAPPKPSRWDRKAEARAERRAHDVARVKHRAHIFRLDNGRCRCCQRKVWLKVSQAPHELAVGHVHEWVKRSQGGDDLDPLNCILLCAECHEKFGNHDDIVPMDPARLMRGQVMFVEGPDPANLNRK
jgi:HNH endonuclease